MRDPKGYLPAIGGAEDRGIEEKQKDTLIEFKENGILKALVTLIAKHDTPKIEVISTASSLPEELAKEYKGAFKKLECLEVGHLNIQSREEAEDPKVLARLAKANCVFFTGGDQAKLCSILGGTQLFDAIKSRYEDERFFIAGTSAGAAAMSHTIITGGDPAKGYNKRQVDFGIGFGFIPEAIIDTHFDERGRLARLLQAIAAQPGIIGIGLGEDTGVIVEKGHMLTAIGSGTVVIVEGSKLSHNNYHELEDNAPITLGSVTLHTLSYADKFDLKTKELKAVGFKEYEKR